MHPTQVTFGAVANALLSQPSVHRSAIITAPGTGNKGLDEIKLRRVRHAIVLKYSQPDELDGLVGTYGGCLDVVVVDPSHGYESSAHCLKSCLQLLSPGGALLCHDCVPPPDATSVERVAAGEWCGVTFAAFRDLMTAQGIRWCTVAADYGLGVAIAPPHGLGVDGAAAVQHWTPASHGAYLNSYRSDPFGFMRSVRPEMWSVAIERLRMGGDITDLAATFRSWDDLRLNRHAARHSSVARRAISRVLAMLRGSRRALTSCAMIA